MEEIFESNFAEISSPCIHVLVGVVYLPKGVNDAATGMMDSTLSPLNKSKLSCFVMGDLNCNILDKDDPTVFSFYNLTSSYTLGPLHNLPTRGN